MMQLELVICVLLHLLIGILAQSNYANQANSIEYWNSLPEEATLDGKVTKLDDLSPVIFLNRTKAALNCAAGSMQVELKFDAPFYGIAYANFDRDSACNIIGKGDLTYRIELPLKGCGTVQDPQRVFSNNIVVRFHPGLEIDGDEIITIVCRYPPPIAPPPAGLPAAIQIPEVPAAILAPPLKGIQILFIICAIMFLTLLLLGLGVSYYCLRRRPIIIQRLPYSMGSGSDVTKLSGDSLANLPNYTGVKIPRAHAFTQHIQSSSSSEAPQASDTIPSDYPSESQSEVEELDVRSLPISSAGSYDVRNCIQNTSDIYVEEYNHAHEVFERELPQDFDIRFKLAKPPSPPISVITSSDSESCDVAIYEKNNLSTIVETHEDVDSVNMSSYQVEDVLDQSYSIPMEDNTKSMTTWKTVQTNDEIYDMDIHSETIPTFHPTVTKHAVDDLQTRKITERKTVENVEKFKKIITDYKTLPHYQEPEWEVAIKPLEDSKSNWENFSDVTSNSSYAPSFTMNKVSANRKYLAGQQTNLLSPELVGGMSSIEIPPKNSTISNWDVLVRVIENTNPEHFDDASSCYSIANLQSQLSVEDKTKWKDILISDSQLLVELAEARERSDFEKIRYSAQYNELFDIQSWDIIIRILTLPHVRDDVKSNKREFWDTRSRRSSLPTLYEYDSDGGSSVRTINNDIVVQQNPAYQFNESNKRKKPSTSSMRSDKTELRSMTEITVDFHKTNTKLDFDEKQSLHKSLSQPSLPRSNSEFTEQWATIESSRENSPYLGHKH